MSIILRPALAPARLPPLSIVVGLAVRAALARFVDEGSIATHPRRGAIELHVKWPNDVVARALGSGSGPSIGRKLAGVLVEASSGARGVEHVIVGIGVNVRRSSFPDELASRATSLSLLGGSASRTDVAVEIVRRLDDELALHLAGTSSLAARLAPFDALAGRRVRLEDGRRGVAAGVDDEGRLQVAVDGGGEMARAVAGEVSPDDAEEAPGA
jgi:BirA family biotin operon repressor/biotin-[acetyl-CoA-carboxylase] ligase